MFVNRFVVVVDACTLVSVLRRNTLLSLAAAGLFRVRWSAEILTETEEALTGLFSKKDLPKPEELAAKQRLIMEQAFAEAEVENYECHIDSLADMPDTGDAHVVAAAIACDASLVVTENLKDFPIEKLNRFGMEAKNGDTFIADTIDLYPSASVSAISEMRKRFKKPSIDAKNLIMRYEANEMYQTASMLEKFEAQI